MSQTSIAEDSKANAGSPSSVDFALDIADLGNELLTKFDTMRSFDPICWSEINHAWMITGHAEVTEGFQGLLPLSNVRLPHMAVAHVPEEERYKHFPNLMEAPKTWLLNMDGSEHIRLRRLMTKAFSRPVIELLRPNVQRYIEETLDEVGKIDGPLDFVSRIGRVIPARVILKQLGLEDTLIPKLHRWSMLLNSVGNLNVTVETLVEIDHTLVEMRRLFEPEFEKRRREPTDDFLSALVSETENGDKLSNDEMFGICVITLIAGHDTTTNTMTLGIAALAKDKASTEIFRGDPALVPNAIMELQRRIAMSTMQGRVVRENFDWKGHALRKGDIVLLANAAANRDPSVFPDPDTTDFSRKQFSNMTFAPGLHHCIGFMLAKMILGEFFPRMLKRFDLELLDNKLDFGPTLVFRGLNRLNVRLHARG